MARDVGGYKIIGPWNDDSVEPRLLVLDTNVLIDMRNFYFSGRRPNFGDLQALLLTFPNLARGAVDLNYGWGALEGSWVRGSGLDAIRYRELKHAAESMVSWDENRIRAAFAHRYPPANQDKAWRRGIAIEHPEDPRPVLAVNYASVLYLFELSQDRVQKGAKSGLAHFQKFVDWVTNELGSRSSYPISLAMSFLIGDPAAKDAARGVLKFSGSEDADQMASKSWNVAWDMWITGLAEGHTWGLLESVAQQPTAIVTRDGDPVWLRAGNEARVLFKTSKQLLPLNTLGTGLSKDVTDLQVQDVLDMDPLETLARFDRDPFALMRQASRVIRDLETHLGVSTRFSHDDWNLEGS